MGRKVFSPRPRRVGCGVELQAPFSCLQCRVEVPNCPLGSESHPTSRSRRARQVLGGSVNRGAGKTVERGQGPHNVRPGIERLPTSACYVAL